jgi:uncharacterized membrane-anchored protein
MKKSELKQIIKEELSEILMKGSSKAAKQADVTQSDMGYIKSQQTKNKHAKELFNKEFKDLDKDQKNKVLDKIKSI